MQIFSWKSLQANYFCNVIDHPGMAFFHSLFMVCCILCQSLTIYWLGKGGWWVSTSRIHQILVDVRPGLNSAEQGVSLESSGKLNHLIVCGAGTDQHVCLSLSKDWFFLDVWYRRTDIDFSCSPTYVQKDVKKFWNVKQLIFLYQAAIVKYVSLIPCVT